MPAADVRINVMRLHRVYRKSEKVIVLRPGGFRWGWFWGALALLLAAAAGFLFWGTSGALTGEDKYIRLCAEREAPSSVDGVPIPPEQAEELKELVGVLSWQRGSGGRTEGIKLYYEEQDVTLVIGTDGKNTVIWGKTGKRLGFGQRYAAPASVWQSLLEWKGRHPALSRQQGA